MAPTDFLNVHPVYSPMLLAGLVLFPRVTMLFLGPTFSWLYALGWLLMPRFTVALFATMYYHEENPVLVACSWLVFFLSMSKRIEENDKLKAVPPPSSTASAIVRDVAREVRTPYTL